MYGHRRKNFDAAGQYIQRQAGQDSRAQGSNDQWESPVGLRSAAVICVVKVSSDTAAESDECGTVAQRGRKLKGAAQVGRQQSVVVSERGGGSAQSKALLALKDLPEKCFTEEPHDQSGIQFYTRVRMGISTHDIMLDGGSGVNSTTEELVLQLINENEAQGIKLNDKRHPIRVLGK